VLNTTLCDKICQCFAAGGCFSPGIPISSTIKTDRHEKTEIVLTVVLNTITPTLNRPHYVELLVPESTARPVVSASALSWSIKYCFTWNLHLINNLIIIYTIVNILQAQVTLTDFGYMFNLWLLTQKADDGYFKYPFCLS
jgi:hypothetical protein